MSKQRINPRRIPCTKADVERAKREAQDFAVSSAMAIMLTVLNDKFNGREYIEDVWREVQNLSQSVIDGYVSVADLKRVLRDEYNIELH